jgi:hypothetical protein
VAVGGRSSCLLGRARACGAVRAQSGGRDPKRRRARRDRTRRSYGLQGATQPRRPAAIMMRGDARPHAGISLCCCFGAPAFAGFFPSPLLSPRSRNLLSPSVLPSCDSGRCRTECSFFLRKLPGYPLPSSHRPRFAKKKVPTVRNQPTRATKSKPNQTKPPATPSPSRCFPAWLICSGPNYERKDPKREFFPRWIWTGDGKGTGFLEGPDRGKEPGCVRPPHPR